MGMVMREAEIIILRATSVFFSFVWIPIKFSKSCCVGGELVDVSVLVDAITDCRVYNSTLRETANHIIKYLLIIQTELILLNI